MHKLDPLNMPLEGIRLIEASAGTGKTWTIATLYLRLIMEKHLSVRDILVVTFTNAATEELRGRIRERIREAMHLLNQGSHAINRCEDEILKQLVMSVSDPRESVHHLMDQLTCIDEAAIHTIHGFSQRMLQEHAFESGALFENEFLQSEDELLEEICRDYWRKHFYPAPLGLIQQVKELWPTPMALKRAMNGYLQKPYQTLLPVVDADGNGEERYQQLYTQLKQAWEAHSSELIEAIESAVNDGFLSKSKDNYRADNWGAAIAAMQEFLHTPPELYASPYGLELFTSSRLENGLSAKAKKNAYTLPQSEILVHAEALLNLVKQLHSSLKAQAIEACAQALVLRKQQAAVLSFDDLLSHLHAALHKEGGEHLAEHIRSRYPYALIDEFQDTDALQFGIFKRIYAETETQTGATTASCGFYMIGDPKQAIYSFRGADIFTYMQAKHLAGSEHQYTLDTNWRSASRLIQAVNALYAQSPAPFVYAGEIDYHPVQASPQADAQPLLIEGSTPAPLQCWFVERSEERLTSRNPPRLKMDRLKDELAEACASEVARLIKLGQQHKASIGDTPLVPNDIAVLVRNRNEAADIRAALRRKNVGSAYYSRDSVLDSDEAQEMFSLLQAINEPGNESLLRAALSTRMVGLNAQQLDALLEDDQAWEDHLARVYDYHQLWSEQGFMPMFRQLIHEQAIPQRLLARADGERRLTNLLQIAELIQAASREQPGMENQLRWYSEQLDQPDGNQEDQRLRLESDENLVKVVNIHTSKGLEYPVVLLPYLWASRPVKKAEHLHYHDGQQTVLHLEPDAHARLAADTERLAEELRLIYVALTRAKHLCYFSYGFANGLEQSALGWLLHGKDLHTPLASLKKELAKLSDAELKQVLLDIEHSSGGSLRVTELPAPHPPIDKVVPPATQLSARIASREVNWHWRMTSYSGLTASHSGSSQHGEFHQTGSTGEDSARPQESEAEQAELLDLHHFPKGAKAGTFMHTILEHVDFSLNDTEGNRKVIERERQRDNYEDKWQAAIEQMVENALTSELNDQGLCLQRLSPQQRIVEMEFQYPIRGLNAAAINRLLASQDEEALHFSTVSGIMRGFVDLTFEYDGRYYIADYKSNWLGYRHEDYSAERLAQVIMQHRYDLQYLLYTLALHRYLKANLKGYDYEQHYGGVYYLFLRGMSPAHKQNGVFHARPELALIEQLDRMMRGAAL